MPFIDRPDLILLDRSDSVFTDGILSYYDELSKQLFSIAPKFKSDCATIPQSFWTLVGHPLLALYRYPTILHDFLYENGVVKRKIADKMLRNALIEEGCDAELAAIFYLAVRTFGKEFYRGVY